MGGNAYAQSNDDTNAALTDASVSTDDGEIIEIEDESLSEDSESGLLLERQFKAVVSDSISSQEMSKSPGSTAASAVSRVVAATVVDGRYLYLRGLGDRYVNVLFNGARLPSTELDRQAIPLHLFPKALLSSLAIQKSYSADNPATFAGGTLDIWPVYLFHPGAGRSDRAEQ